MRDTRCRHLNIQPGRQSNWRISCLALSLFVLMTSCSKEPEWKRNSFVKQDLTRSASDVTLPRSLWGKIEDLSIASQAATVEGEHVRTEVITAFDPLKVYLIEKNKGILKHGNVELDFASGGGEFDLADFVEEKNGSFYIVLEFMPESKDSNTSVFYLSNAIGRKAGNQVLGAGCHTYLDVSGAVNKSLSDKGILLNTTNGRHVSVLAGTYFFAQVTDDKLHLASLKIRDSAHLNLQCPRK